MDWERILAVVTDAGSSTYHTAILARSLGIPAVVALRDATRRIPPGSLVVVDGTRGDVVVEPSGPVLEAFRATQEADRREEERLQGTRHLAAVTQDGASVHLRANVEFTEEAATAVVYGAEGIGLFRSEYLLGRARRWPSEDEQVDAYRRLLDQMRPHPVTVRTWDVGLEEVAPGSPSSPNPALGERALRLLRRDTEPFRIQLRALLRAAVHGPLRIMFPFASGLEDLRLALALLAEARSSLRHEGAAFAEDLPVGLNLEVPSAALVADLLAAEVDFFSIGTNDLIQYLLAVDRADPRVAGLYQPLHPAVLRTIAEIVRVGEAHAVPVSLCGEMAADPQQAVMLMGLGLRDLSMTPAAIPRVKAALRSVHEEQARGWPAAASPWVPPPRSKPSCDGSSRSGGSPSIPSRSESEVSENPKRVEKPWGYEIWWARTDRYVGKILHINKGASLSLQYHEVKEETILVQAGRMLVETKGKDEPGELRQIEMKPGDIFHVTPGTLHRMTGLEDCDLVEVSTPELHDVVRLEDRYGRAGTKEP